MTITYVEKGIGMHEAINAAGHWLEQRFNGGVGTWVSDNDAAVQAIINSYDPTARDKYAIKTMLDGSTLVRLRQDFTTSSASAVDCGLGFTPKALTQYEFEFWLRLRTATLTVNPRPGLAWPTGFADGTALIQQSQTAAGGQLLTFGNVNAALLGAVGGLPDATQSWPCIISGEIGMGASPTGAVRAQLASETAGTVVTLRAGSYLKYREVSGGT